MDIPVSPSLVIPAAELRWRFSRSSGPGGQHVNTTDTRVELRWDVAASGVLGEVQRERIARRLDGHITDGELVVTASEHRSQLRNRQEAATKMATLVQGALAAPPRKRRPTKPTRGSVKRNKQAKQHRSQIKQLRKRPARD